MSIRAEVQTLHGGLSIAAVSTSAFTVHSVLLVLSPQTDSVYSGSLSHSANPFAPGDLGSIDAKYDIAVSSCTGMLDHIVVDSMSTAQVSRKLGWAEAPLAIKFAVR